MKKIFWMPLLAMAALLASCVQQTLEDPQPEEIMAVAELPESEDGFETTKSVVSENGSSFEMIWDTKEAIGVYGNRLTNVKFTSTNKYYKQASTTFSGGSLLSSPKYAYYPYSSENSSNDMNSVRGDLPSTQSFSTVIKKMNTDYKIGFASSNSVRIFSCLFCKNSLAGLKRKYDIIRNNATTAIIIRAASWNN